MPFYYPFNCSKFLLMKPVWASFYCSASWESYASAILYCPRSVAAQDIPPLALLRESGLLLDRKQGKWVHYRLSPHIPAWAAKIIDEAPAM